MTVHKSSDGSRYIKMNSDPPENSCRPSVDVLFRSAVNAFAPNRTLCVIMTGMGADGLEGVRNLKDAQGGYCITQSEETCIVYGMPRSIVEAGLHNEVIHLDNLPDRIVEIVHG